MITQILSIARNAFVESIRQPIFFVLVLVAAALQFFNTATAAFSMGYTESGEFSGDTKWLLDIGLGTVLVLGTLLAAFVSTAVVSREIENKTVLTVVSKPIPRPLVVVGKYLGVAASLLIAVGCMLIFLLLALRHGVLTAVADEFDPPVIIFGFAALLGSIAIAAWCNYFYGWYFSHTAMVAMLPLLLIAYFLVLLLNKQWEWQPITTDLKPQTLFACLGLTTAILALAALATAVSTRLGQVMTIIVCASVFLFGLLSNYLLGRHVFNNQAIAIIATAEHPPLADPGWSTPGATYTITFDNPPRVAPAVGNAFYYGPSPTGFPLAVSRFTPFTGDPARSEQLINPATPPALVVTAITPNGVVVRKTGQNPLSYERPPTKGDYAFLQHTTINPIAMALWAIVPNMHYYWLLDAVSQNQLIPPTHMAMVLLYGLLQIIAFLALGVALFQARDVG